MSAPPGARRERIGRYTLLERIASGGMAEIFRASSEGSDGIEHVVAIKRILPENARNNEFMTMFLNEARIAATLRHPNVIQAYDFGSENGSYYLAMEYLHGLDTRRVVQSLALAGKKLPLEIAIASAIGICAGLQYVHDKRDKNGHSLGLVHRDVSPQNIFLTTSGGVKLVDFGVAKAVHRVSDTLSGTIKGKVTYMSPEQVRAERLDRRSDLFSLSIVLWELTVGRRLFEGVSEAMVMNAIDKLDAPAPSQMTPRYSPDLERIVMKGLARDRDRRYRTADEMRIDLEAFAREQRLDVTPRTVASFVRSVQADGHATDAAPTPSPVQREFERALRSAHTPREPKAAVSDVTPAIVVRSLRRVIWFATLGLVAGAGIGIGGAWYAKHRASTSAVAPAPAAAAPPNAGPSKPAETAPPPRPPVPPPPPTPTIEEPPTELVPPPMHPHRDVVPASDEPTRQRPGAHAKRHAHDPSPTAPAPVVEKWGAGPAPASPR
jgi:serine/threonine protein kinase